MKIFPNLKDKKFNRLLSLYLDNEASEKELQELSNLLAFNGNYSRMFKTSCRIQAAAKRLYGKESKLRPLPSPIAPSRREVLVKSVICEILEWSGIGGLAISCIALVILCMNLSNEIQASENKSNYYSQDVLANPQQAVPCSSEKVYISEKATLQFIHIIPDSSK